jgi:hypothetical protein
LKRSPGQHPLLGFHMDAELVAFAAQVGVGFDFDEYADQQD